MRVAVVHDGTIYPGGAVRVVTEAAHALDADLFVGFSGKEHSWWADRVPNDVTILRRTSKAGRINDVRTVRKILSLTLEEYDVVITSGPAAKFVQPYDDQWVVHYLHHPPLSTLWYTGGLFAYLVKMIDRIETWAIPNIVANSKLTATRAIAHYNREVDAVIPPPVPVEEYTTTRERTESQVVMVGRLEERKRPEIAVQAMERLPECSLVMVGDGPLRGELEGSAPDNVEFLGYADDETLRTTVEESEAGLFLAEREDFGITPIEYMAAGTPVVGVDEPNTNNQVDEVVGTLVDPTPDAVAEGITSVLSRDWDRSTIRSRAESYSVSRFRTAVEGFVEAKGI